MSTLLHPHGAARAAVDDVTPMAFPPLVREQLARAEVDESEAHLAWELCRGIPLDRETLGALSMLVLLVLDAQARGSTRLAVDPASLGPRAAALGADPEPLRAILPRLSDDPFARLIGGPGDRRPLTLEDGHLYTTRLHTLECQLATRVGARLAEHSDAGAVEHAIEALQRAPTVAGDAVIDLTEEQRAGVRAALTASLSVISGGPGTGKTSIVVAILRAAMRSGRVEGPSGIALAAPTGKAADRMRRALVGSLASIRAPSLEDARLREALPTPKTLHRLLGWSPSRGRFRHHADNPLAVDLVVVDESSMVDVFMMAQLVSSLRPRTRLVLLGDAEQLPSVAAGAVFRDLAGDLVGGRTQTLQPGRTSAVHLTESHRMNPDEPAGFNVLRVATQINEGRRLALAELDSGRPSAPDAVGRLRAIPASLDALEGVCLLEPTPAGREAFLDRWLTERVDPGSIRPLSRRTWQRAQGRIAAHEEADLNALFSHLERARLLTVTRGASRPTGAEAINQSLHQRMTASRRAGPGWVAGEPTLVSRNDYDRGLFNGDQGIVLWTEEADAPGPRLHVVFRREPGFVTFPLESVRPTLSLGYATTVHKAQGSEHDQVAVMLPEHDSRLLTREILYTAVTRARRSVLIVGDKALLDRAVNRTIERSSGIAGRIAEFLAENTADRGTPPQGREDS
ncbi:MAG: exodeoxyribonuclease V subunit alpha [Sandaracinaceae bacterium]